MRSRLGFAGMWGLLYVLGRLPTRALYAGADALGTASWYVSRRIRGVTRSHMRHVLGDAASNAAIDSTARGCARSAARYWADFARSVHVSREEAFAEVDSYEGLEHVFAAADRGCGVVMVSAHVGAPEFLARAAGYLGLDLLALTERLEDQRINDLLHVARSSSGTRFAQADAAGLRTTLQHLRRGGLLAMMGDRDIQGNGRTTRFFGAPARLPSGPVELSLRTGAPIVPGFVYRTRGTRKRMRFLPEVAFEHSGDRAADIEAGVSALARALEAGIAAAPSQWFALQPVWELASARPARLDAGDA